MKEPLENITIIPDESNTQKWTVHIGGPVSHDSHIRQTPSQKSRSREKGIRVLNVCRLEHHTPEATLSWQLNSH